ncbi:MAG: PLP-dependent aminotransferase family protein [Desulfovibrionaceae bacterium]|jgi:2-aminoadipate transaminase|nr:PLP-dependent aminotransferase family protein [Desulfovibrionaceae bacterium]
MQLTFAHRTDSVHRSFIREILKVTARPEIISFAGGLPNPALFPVEAMRQAAGRILGEDGADVLQYSTTEGHAPLREYIAARYKKRFGMIVSPDDILITTGSQQGLDLLGKVFLDRGTPMVVERPGYLGAIQAFSVFEPRFMAVELEKDGPNLDELERALDQGARLFYAVTNFQNPSGLTYSLEKRKAVAALMEGRDAVLVEDDPYGELRFAGEFHPPIRALGGDNCILLGTFSKVTVPGFRLGWIVAPKEILSKAVVMKQGADLHTSTLAQRLLYEYLETNDLDAHVERIRQRYGAQCRVMTAACERHFPEGVSFTRPEGGMFLWAALPEGYSAMDLLDKAIARNVAFVPGRPFYVEPGMGENTLRLNFSNSDEARIEEGIGRLGQAMKELLGR